MLQSYNHRSLTRIHDGLLKHSQECAFIVNVLFSSSGIYIIYTLYITLSPIAMITLRTFSPNFSHCHWLEHQTIPPIKQSLITEPSQLTLLVSMQSLSGGNSELEVAKSMPGCCSNVVVIQWFTVLTIVQMVMCSNLSWRRDRDDHSASAHLYP